MQFVSLFSACVICLAFCLPTHAGTAGSCKTPPFDRRRCYQLYWDRQQSWSSSSKACQATGQRLASAENGSLLKFIKDNILYKRVWVGLKRAADGQPDTWTNDGNFVPNLYPGVVLNVSRPGLDDGKLCSVADRSVKSALVNTICTENNDRICETVKNLYLQSTMIRRGGKRVITYQSFGVIKDNGKMGKTRKVRFTPTEYRNFKKKTHSPEHNEPGIIQQEHEPRSIQQEDHEPNVAFLPAETESEMAEPSSHKKRMINEAEGWQKIRPALGVARMEGFCPASKQCSFCGSSEVPQIVWCPDCGPNTLYCMMCSENIHRVVMYHQSYVWKNDVSMFVPLIKDTTLIHEHSCDSIYSRQIRVVDSLGRQHTVKSHFCHCEPEAVTLVRRGLWPATPKQPETAFTITLMELGRMLQLEGQLSLQKFCFALERRNTFLPPHTTDCRNLYLALGNALTEFHHHQVSCLEMAHSPDILSKNCPVCTLKPERSVISMDANFGLVHKKHSGSGPGLQYARFRVFSSDESVRDFTNNHSKAISKSVPESSECSDFQAGDMLRAKNKSSNLDIKGVFGSVCHHGFPLHFVNMEHGERFAYPVYIMKQIATGQVGATTEKQIVMYDVACRLQAHLRKYPELTGQLAERFRLVVPVFHSFAHNTKCQMTFGQRYCEGTGLIDGEAMERLWSYLRKFLWSKEMTLPNRQDLLSSALLNYGRRIFCSIVQTLSVRLKKARQIQLNSKVIISDMERKYDGNAVDWLHQLTQILVTNDGQRDPLMEKARKLSTERQQLLALKKRYADGQKIAMRLTKKLHVNTTLLQAVGSKLKDKGIDVLFAQLADPKSPLYEGNNHNLCKEQVQAANTVAECCRAEEEEKRIIEDINLLQQWLVHYNNPPSQSLIDGTRYNHGLNHAKSLSKLKVEDMLHLLQGTFGHEPGLQKVNFDCSIGSLLSATKEYPALVDCCDDVTDMFSDIDTEEEDSDMDGN